jgi:hypothetical protein
MANKTNKKIHRPTLPPFSKELFSLEMPYVPIPQLHPTHKISQFLDHRLILIADGESRFLQDSCEIRHNCGRCLFVTILHKLEKVFHQEPKLRLQNGAHSRLQGTLQIFLALYEFLYDSHPSHSQESIFF